jgi:hypothetical protein
MIIEGEAKIVSRWEWRTFDWLVRVSQFPLRPESDRNALTHTILLAAIPQRPKRLVGLPA